MATLECDAHGKYQAWRQASHESSPYIIRDCPKCLAEDIAKQNAQRRERDAQHARRRRLKEIMGLAGIPARFVDRTLDNYVATTPGQRIALSICRGYAESWLEQFRKGGSLVLTGKVGTGKTHLACAIANAVIPEHMATAAFGTVAKIIRSIKSTYGGKGSETQAIADLLKVDLLIIDEVGVQNGSDHELTMLFEIINERYQNLRPTILISNLNTDDLEKFLGQRVMDRFRGCGTVVAFDWASHRGAQQDLV